MLRNLNCKGEDGEPGMPPNNMTDQPMMPSQVENETMENLHNGYSGCNVTLHEGNTGLNKTCYLNCRSLYEMLDFSLESNSTVLQRESEKEVGNKESVYYSVDVINGDPSQYLIKGKESDVSGTNATRKQCESNNSGKGMVLHKENLGLGTFYSGNIESLMSMVSKLDRESKISVGQYGFLIEYLNLIGHVGYLTIGRERGFDASDWVDFQCYRPNFHSRKTRKGIHNTAGLDTKYNIAGVDTKYSEITWFALWINALKTHFREIKVFYRLKVCQTSEVIGKKDIKLSCAHLELSDEQSPGHIKEEAKAAGNQVLELTGDDHVAESLVVPDCIDGGGLLKCLIGSDSSNLLKTPGFTLRDGRKEVPVCLKSKAEGKDFLQDTLNIPDFLQLPPQVIQAYPVFAESGYNSEFMRLASFSKCPEENWYPAVPLSENGFYLIPVSTVICHFCKSTYPTWQKDWDPKQKHQPGCPILSEECVNIPMKPSSDNGKYQTAVQFAMTDLQLHQLHHKNEVLLRNTRRAVEAFKNPQLPEVQMGSLSIGNAGQTEYDAMEDEPQQSTSNGASNTSQGPIDGASNTRGLRYFIHTYDEHGRPISTSQKVDFSNKDDKTNASMKREIDRLQTYTNWKKHNIIKPEELAKAGFYYADSGDRVRCAFCSGVLRNWASGDRATTEHKRHYPTCPFVLNLDVGNVPLVPDQSSLQSPTPATSNPKAQNGTNTTTQRAPTAQRSTSNVPLLTAGYTPSPIAGTILIPKHTNFSTAEARMLTYESWPTTNVQRPNQLAEAGFFYTGSGDNVRCFHCDGGLRNWLDADLPWIEHAKWFPRCGYLQREKGPEFVLEETRKHSQQNFSGGMTQVRSTGASSTPGTGNSSAGVRRVEAREVRARFDTDQVKMILEMGYKEAVVKYVILQRLKHTGDDFGSIQEMLEAVLTEEPNLEEKGVSYYENILQQEFGRPMTIVYPQVPQLPGPGSNQENSTPTSATPMTQSTAASLEIPGDEKSLVEENRQLKEQTTCKICMDNEVSMVFVPCGHLVACADCAPNLRQCPICRRAITATIRTFLS